MAPTFLGFAPEAGAPVRAIEQSGESPVQSKRYRCVAERIVCQPNVLQTSYAFASSLRKLRYQAWGRACASRKRRNVYGTLECRTEL